MSAKLPATLGQHLMAASMSVVVASDQGAIPVSGTVTVGNATLAVTQSGVWTVATNADAAIGGTAAPAKGLLILGKTTDATPAYDPLPLSNGGAAVKIDGSATTQPVSGTVTVGNATLAVTQSGTFTVGLSAGAQVQVSDGTNVIGTALHPVQVSLANTAANATAVKVDGSGVTQPVSGTVTANQGGAPWSVAGNVGSGVTDTGNPVKVGGVFNSAAPTFTTGQRGDLQLDSSGRLIVNIGAGGGTGGTASSFSAAFPATGTAAGASDGTNMKPLLVDASGFLKVNVAAGGGSGGTSSSFGVAFPATGTAIGASDGTNMKALLVNGTGLLKVDGSGATQPISGTVTANIGTTNGLALDATLTGGTAKTIARGGQKGTTNTNADITHTPSGLNHEAIDVAIYDGSGNQLGLSATPLRTDPTGTTTQPVSAASLPLPAGASTAAKQPALGTAGTASADVITVQGIASMTPILVNGSGVTQPVSGTVTANAGTGTFTVGQATAANLNAQVQGAAASGAAKAGNPVQVGGVFNTSQPTVTSGQAVELQATAHGAAIVATGTDAFTVTIGAGSAVMGHVIVDSGAITANVGTTGGLALDATLTGGTAKSITRGGQKGTTNTNADITHTASGANHEALDVVLYDASGNQLGLSGTPVRVDPTGSTTQPVSIAGTVTVTQSAAWNCTIGTALPAGTNQIGHVVNDAGTAVIGAVVPSAATGSAAVGATPFSIVSAANTTPVQIKGTGGTSSAGTLWDLIAINVGTTPIYARFFDKATSPTMGTDTPKYVLPLPSAGTANGGGAARSFPVGLAFTAGIWVSFTTGIALLDNTQGAASQVALSGGYV